MKPHKLKIDVLKINKEHLWRGQKGTYLDCAIWPNKDGEDQYGDTHYVVQEISKEARERGEKGAIIGNLRIEGAPIPPPASPKPTPPAPKPDLAEEDIPF